MADANGNGNGGPWWYRGLKDFGPTASIAVFLVYTVAGEVRPALQQIFAAMAAHQSQADTLIKDERDDSAQRGKQWEVISNLTKVEHEDREAALELEQQTCINTAKSPFQSQKCLEIRNQAEAKDP